MRSASDLKNGDLVKVHTRNRLFCESCLEHRRDSPRRACLLPSYGPLAPRCRSGQPMGYRTGQDGGDGRAASYRMRQLEGVNPFASSIRIHHGSGGAMEACIKTSRSRFILIRSAECIAGTKKCESKNASAKIVR